MYVRRTFCVPFDGSPFFSQNFTGSKDFTGLFKTSENIRNL